MIPKVFCADGPLDGEYSYSAVPPTASAASKGFLPSSPSYVSYADHSVILPDGKYARIFVAENMTDRDVAKAVKKHFR
jgi:hypothetical protein